MKSPKASFSQLKEDIIAPYDKISKVAQIIDMTISKFNSKYFEVSNILNDMRLEFLGQMSSILDQISQNKSSLSTTESFKSIYSPIKVNSRQPKLKHNNSYRTNKSSCTTSLLQTETNESSHKFHKEYQLMNKTVRNSSNQYFSNKKLIKNLTNQDKKASRNKKVTSVNGIKKDKVNSYNNTYTNVNKASNNTVQNMNLNSLSSMEKKNNMLRKSILKRPNAKEKQLYMKKFMNSLEIFIKNDIVPINEKMKIKFLNKETYNTFNIKDIFKQSKQVIKNRMDKINITSNCYAFYDKKYPSRTAQVGLNFISEEKQKEIINDNSDNTKKVIEIIYSLLNENSTYKSNQSTNDLLSYLFEKFKKENLRNLFLDKIYSVIFFNNEFEKKNWEKLSELYNNFEENLFNISKDPKNPLCWVSFSLIEIFEYLSLCFSSNYLYNKEYETLKNSYSKIDAFLLKH